MKTAITEGLQLLHKEIKFINLEDTQEDKYFRAGLKHAYNIFNEKLTSEKNNLENSYIQGFCHSEYEGVMDFDKYYASTFETNKETLK